MEKAICRRLSFLDNEIIKKNKEIEKLTSKVLILENKISEINGKNSDIEEVQEKIEAHEKKFEKLFEVLDKGFDFLKEKVKLFGEDMDDLAIELNDDIGNLTVESEENPLQQTFKNPFLGIRCNFCDFSAKSERGLKTHKSRKHCNCNWCDFTCKDESEFKEHKLDKHSMEYSVEILQSCYF